MPTLAVGCDITARVQLPVKKQAEPIMAKLKSQKLEMNKVNTLTRKTFSAGPFV